MRACLSCLQTALVRTAGAMQTATPGTGKLRGPRTHIDGACAQRGDIKYGLNYGGDAPDDDARCAVANVWELLRGEGALLHYPDANMHTQHGTCCRRERRAATQRNLEEAAKRKAEEEREKAAQRYVRKEYK